MTPIPTDTPEALMTTSQLRRLPLPRWEPPFDDELTEPALTPPGRHAMQGALALAFVLPNGVPAVPAVPPAVRTGPALRLVAQPESEEAVDDLEFGPQPTPRSALPEPRSWAGRFVQAVVEVLAGDRPAGQLVRWTTEDVFDEVAYRVIPPRSSRSRRNVPAPERPVVRSVHVSEPGDGVAEVCALVRRGVRSTAVALRLEGIDGRWQCTAIELG
jgi:uncharacterized protein DUF6459